MNKACDLVDILDLMGASAIHKQFTVSDIHRLIYPPIILDQYKLFHKDGKPVAYASWAYLSEEAKDRHLARQGLFQVDDWKSGATLWFMDFIAPFGGVLKCVRELHKLFPDQKIAFTSRSYGTGKVQRLGNYSHV